MIARRKSFACRTNCAGKGAVAPDTADRIFSLYYGKVFRIYARIHSFSDRRSGAGARATFRWLFDASVFERIE